jgi:nuclease HARBI1
LFLPNKKLFSGSFAISAETKLLSALRFYATGCFMITRGDFSGISRTSIGRIVKQGSEAIANLKNEYIFIPRNQQELVSHYQSFFRIGKFPTVVGTIDCTHIKISGQGGGDGEVFRNRKQFFSINVQSVSDAGLKFQNIVARWPGSTHDSLIFNESNLKQRFENGEFGNGVLLGDGGYKLYTYLMTPFRTPNTEDQTRYNHSQILVRNTVERQYGVWKRRFPCLVYGLRCKLETSLTVIVACAVLHNFCMQQKDDMPTPDAETEAAIELTTCKANNNSIEIANKTNSENKRAVLKRESFMQQISELNDI